MFTLLYNELKTMDKLPRGNSGKTLSSFTDTGDIAPWARDAMKFMVENGTIGGKLAPLATTTRAEMAQVLSNLLGK